MARTLLQRSASSLLMGLFLLVLQASVTAERVHAAPAVEQVGAALDIAESVKRMHQASQEHSYKGTFVVLSSTGQMASSRIWNACNGKEHIERIDVLGGAPRTVFRHNDEVRTFVEQTRTVYIDPVGVQKRFPAVVPMAGSPGIAQHYQARSLGTDRVAGHLADVVRFEPRDGWRYGYRIWLEKASGLVLKLQTLAPDHQVLEQSAFVEVDLSTSIPMEPMVRAMESMEGYRVAPIVVQPLALEQAGWALKEAIPGFEGAGCYRRQVSARQAGQVVQCIYSDGMAAVSMFFERFEADRHGESVPSAWGATHILAQRVAPDVWLTVVGEVPLATLRQFASKVQRIR